MTRSAGKYYLALLFAVVLSGAMAAAEMKCLVLK